MKITILLFLVCFCFSSCQVMVSSILGVKNPVAKTDTEIKNNIKNSPFSIYRVKESSMDSLLRSEYKPDWGPGFKPIQFICFDKNGKVVAQWASCESEKKSYALSKFPPRSKYPSNPKLNIKTIIDISKPLALTKSDLSEFTKYDYTYVIYFTSWTEKLSTNLIDDIAKYTASRNTTSNIVLVNADYYHYPSSSLK